MTPQSPFRPGLNSELKSRSLNLDRLNDVPTTKWDLEIETLESLLDPKSEVFKLLTPGQKCGLRSLRASLFRGDRRMSSIPCDLLEKSKNTAINTYLLESFGGLESYEYDTRKSWKIVKQATKAHAAITFLSQKVKVVTPQAPKEWDDLPSANRDRLKKMLSWESISKWDFDEFGLNELTNGQPLLFMGWAILGSPKSQRIMNGHDGDTEPQSNDGGYHFDRLGLSNEKLINYLREIESLYNKKALYHNNIHGADVLQTLHTLLQMGGAAFSRSSIEIFAVLLAAAVHDVGHPGRNNNFHVKARTDVALNYNDVSVLENMHASLAFKLTLGEHKKEECEIFDFLNPLQVNQVRGLMIKCLLGTDMANHFTHISELKGLIAELGSTQPKDFLDHVGNPNSKVLQFFLHMADISNQAKNAERIEMWTDRCLGEFFEQGDEERRLGLPITPLCDRYTVNKVDSQVGFVKYVVKPAFTLLSELIPSVKDEVMPILSDNLAYWENRAEAEKEGKEEEE